VISRDIVHRCLERSFIFGTWSFPRPSTCGFECVGPVVSFRVDEMLAEDFSGGEFGDSDGCFVDEQEDAFACVFGADSEVVHVSCSPQ